jgi:hypothetical protein
MINQIHSDKSLQVLVFVALPLLLLLIAAVFIRMRYRQPSAANFRTFSVSLSVVSREDAYIVYRDKDRRLELYAGSAERKQVLWLMIPKELADGDTHVVAQNLATGLVKLGFQKYKITKQGETEVIAGSP